LVLKMLKNLTQKKLADCIIIIRIGEKMPTDEQKFYYYRIKGKNEDSERVSLFEELDESKLKDSPPKVVKNGAEYIFEFEKIGTEYYGEICTSKDNCAYETKLKGKKQWASFDKVAGEGVARDTQCGIGHFAFGKYKKDLIVLMEKGYQHGGINKLADFLNTFLKEKGITVSKKLLKTETSVKAIKQMVSKDRLISMTIDIKKDHPDISENNSTLISALDKLDQEGVEIFVGVKALPRQGLGVKAEGFLRKITNTPDNSDIVDTILENTWIQSAFDSITLEVEDSETHLIKKKDILDSFEQEKILINRNSAKFSLEQKNTLLKYLSEKIKHLMKESGIDD